VLGESRPGGPTDQRARHRGDLRVLARGGTLSLAGAAANGAFGFLLVVVITRGLNPGQAGAFFEALALFLILAQSAGLGADTGLTRTIARYRALGRIRDVRSTLALGLVPPFSVAAVIAVLLFLLAPQLSRLLVGGEATHQDALVPYIRVLAPFVPLSTLATVVMAATRGFGTMVPSVLLDNLVRQGLRPLLTGAVILAGLGSHAIALAWGLPAGVALALATAWLLRMLAQAERIDTGEGTPPRRAGDLAGEFWRFAAPRGVAALFNVTLFRLDTLLVGALQSPGQAGIYTSATRFIVLGFIALTAVQQVIAPQISEMLAVADRDRAEAVYGVATQWLMLMSWPVYLTGSVFAPVLLRVFGPEYAAGQTALTILALASMVNMATGPCSVVLVMGGKSTWSLVNSTVALGLNVALNLLLIPRYGMNGAAAAWGVAMIVNNLLAIVQVRYFLRLSPFGPGFRMAVLVPAVCFGGVGLGVRVAMGESVPSFLLYGVMAGGAYLAILWRLRRRLQLTDLGRALRARTRRPARAVGSPEGADPQPGSGRRSGAGLRPRPGAEGTRPNDPSNDRETGWPGSEG
jgi:O-antigen/teichoic acid export membrane protein